MTLNRRQGQRILGKKVSMHIFAGNMSHAGNTSLDVTNEMVTDMNMF
jgi:hypothetical protein